MPVSVVGRLFFTLTFFAPLVLPTLIVGKVKLVGVTTTCATLVPETGTVCGLPGALSATFRLADSDPTMEGVNVILTLQALPASKVAPQVFAEMTKSLFPVSVMLVRSNVALPVLPF